MNFCEQKTLLDTLHRSLEWPLVELAMKRGVFDLLSEPENANYIAQQLEWDPQKTALFLNGLCSLNLIEKADEKYQLKEGYQAFLLSSSATSMVPTLLHLTRVKTITSSQLEQVLSRKPTSVPETRFDKAEFWQESVRNLRSFHRSCGTEFMAEILSHLPEWGRVKNALEIGAGSETLANHLTNIHSGLTAHIFDLPPVIAQIAPRTADNSRVVLHQGDYNIANLPKGFDLIFSSMSLYYANDLNTLIRQINQSLVDGGIFVSLHEGLQEQRTQPRHHVIGRLLPSLNGNDVSFDQGNIANAMLEAGFRRVKSRSIDTPFGSMELDIAYK
ncbi:methyltransferase domain-containing protein [Vibrio sonorensis]|uniref:methyltransferase domain-containing protein n=1 Tax=Vibrio sonorensis TaxID=1004316 RepID=UPI0008D96890|nr:methyltransferase domain-containing protein [Vibrio sonorensis]